MHPASETDRIERSVVLNASRARVWRAISNPEEFGTWFGVNLKGQTFVPGQKVRGPITYKGWEHIIWEARIDRMEPPALLSFHWHPYAIDPAKDYSAEEPTLVTFVLEEAPGNATKLTVVETGFDKLPPERRLDAYRMNGRGWSSQMESITRHVAS